MSVLTEEAVLQKTRCKGLENVRKLNIWGIGVNDISILRKMPNLEIASCSVNSITTLADFAHCPRLQELYIRKNEIADLAEINFLKNLPLLTSLWLLDNPCSSLDNYRLTVLKHLPLLQKLDNIAVSKEELQLAAVGGDELLSAPPLEGDRYPLPESHSEASVVDCDTEDVQIPSPNISFSVPRSEKDETVSVKTTIFLKNQEKKVTGEVKMESEDREILSDTCTTQNDLQNTNRKNSKILDALLLLIDELTHEELIIVQETVGHRLADRTQPYLMES